MAEAEVLDAAVSQEGTDVSLVIIVRSATNKGRAEQLGDNFVRLAKTFSPDSSPGRSIGTGMYNYVIGVYYPNEKKLAAGAKARNATKISW